MERATSEWPRICRIVQLGQGSLRASQVPRGVGLSQDFGSPPRPETDVISGALEPLRTSKDLGGRSLPVALPTVPRLLRWKATPGQPRSSPAPEASQASPSPQHTFHSVDVLLTCLGFRTFPGLPTFQARAFPTCYSPVWAQGFDVLLTHLSGSQGSQYATHLVGLKMVHR